MVVTLTSSVYDEQTQAILMCGMILFLMAVAVMVVFDPFKSVGNRSDLEQDGPEARGHSMLASSLAAPAQALTLHGTVSATALQPTRKIQTLDAVASSDNRPRIMPQRISRRAGRPPRGIGQEGGFLPFEQVEHEPKNIDAHTF